MHLAKIGRHTKKFQGKKVNLKLKSDCLRVVSGRIFISN